MVKRQALELAAFAVIVVGGQAGAQGAVGGRVTIIERDRETTPDLVNAVIYLERVTPPRGDARRGSAAQDHDHHRAMTADTVGGEVALQGRAFLPRVRVIHAGSQVAFPNRDSFDHNVFTRSALGDFDLGLYGRGVTKTAPFRKSGVYPIYCNIHARMVAYVLALETPYFAQPGDDGRFVIPNIPAGAYRLVVWHERTPQVTQELVVPARGVDAVNVQLDARGYKRPSHKNKFGKDYKKGGDRY